MGNVDAEQVSYTRLCTFPSNALCPLPTALLLPPTPLCFPARLATETGWPATGGHADLGGGGGGASTSWPPGDVILILQLGRGEKWIH